MLEHDEFIGCEVGVNGNGEAVAVSDAGNVLFTMPDGSNESIFMANRLVASYNELRDIDNVGILWHLMYLLEELSRHKKEQKENNTITNQLNVNYDVLRLVNWYDFDRKGV